MIAMDLQSLAQLFASRMLNSAAEGMLLAGLVWLLLRLIRRQNSGTRFAIWLMALAAVVSLPFFGGAARILSQPSSFGLAKLHTAFLHSPFLLSRSWALYLVAAWAVGASVLLLRLGVGMWRLRCLRAACTEPDAASLDPAVAAILHETILHETRSRAPVRLCLSDEVGAPAVIGFFRPAIVFPTRLLPQLSAAEMEIILLHELAHIERGDQWTNLAQKLLKAVFFFHPAVWWIESQLSLEREMACDDVVLTHRNSPRDYAAVLITLAEKLHGAPALALAQALLSRVHQMSRRISEILDARRPGGATLGKPVLGGAVLLIVLALGTAPYAPRIISFRAPSSAAPAERQPVAQTVASADSRAMQADAQEQVSDPAMLVRATWHASEVPLAQLAELRMNDSEPPSPVAAKSATPAATLAKNETRAGGAPFAIPAALHSHTSAVPALASASGAPGTSIPSNTAAVEPAATPTASPSDYVIVQTTWVDASGSRIWTLCVWRLERGGTQRQLESAIALAI